MQVMSIDRFEGEYAVCELENGKKVEMTGKIDRLDTAKSEDGKYVRIIARKNTIC